MKDTIEYLQDLLKAVYIGEYSPGHMGAKILRFQPLDNSSKLIVKLAENNNQEVIYDIESNLIGYNNVKLIGGEGILPLGLQELSIKGAKALMMADLGLSMHSNDQGILGARLLWSRFKNLIVSTRRETLVNTNSRPLFIDEVLSFIERFTDVSESKLLDIIRRIDLSDNYGQPALMLLDFTPDNLFLTGEGLSFIDPWKQKNYLGHPALSFGQFFTLARIYNLSDNEEIASFLRLACLTELPGLLGCSASSVDYAIRLGATLQLTLSAYVRRESDPPLAEIFRQEALELWSL
ncbi:MAG: hypothetical protein WC863_01165 [Patescibacteria group bacterium]